MTRIRCEDCDGILQTTTSHRGSELWCPSCHYKLRTQPEETEYRGKSRGMGPLDSKSKTLRSQIERMRDGERVCVHAWESDPPCGFCWRSFHHEHVNEPLEFLGGVENSRWRGGVEHLYHITAVENASSIIERGLLSKNWVEFLQLKFKDLSHQQVQLTRGLKATPDGRSVHDYVPLYFNPRNVTMYSMERKGVDIVLLAVDPEVLAMPGVFVSDKNAASNTTLQKGWRIIRSFDWDLIFSERWNGNPKKKKAMCAEALIPDLIPREYISSIYVKNSAMESQLKEQGLEGAMQVRPDLFFP